MNSVQKAQRLNGLPLYRTGSICAAVVAAFLMSGSITAAPTGEAMASASEQVAATVLLKGTVVDKTTGEPLINAVVKETKSGKAAATNLDGKFQLNVPADGVLEVSYIGYSTMTVPVNGRTDIEIKLDENTELLDEVVVVGYGAQKKVNLTGSVSSVDFDKSKSSRPMTTMAAALSGMSAGLNVMQTGGKPNSEGQHISIRGVGTLNNAGPLILCDGMEVSLNEVNPNDVASVSILKDAASCAIYGNRGANGVILITTKRGSEGKVNVTYSGKFSLNTPSKIIQQVSNYADYMEMINEGYTNNGQAAKFSEATIKEWRDASANPNAVNDKGVPNYVSHPNTNWYDTLYKKKWMQEHTLTLTGQDTRTEYMISGTFLHNPGILDGAGLNKYYLRTDVVSHVTKFLAVGMRAWGYHNDQKRDDTDNMWAINMQKTTPGIYPYWNGYYGGIETVEEDGSVSNLLQQIHSDHGYYKQDKIFVNPHIEVNLPYGFNFSSNFYYDWFRNNHKWCPSPYLPMASFNRGLVLSQDRTEEQMKNEAVCDWDQFDRSWKTSNILSWNHTYGKHDIGALAGYEEFRKWGGTRDLRKEGMTDINLTDFDTLAKAVYIYGSNWEYSSRSWFGRATYAYDTKYLLEVNMRYDGSSRFNKENRWGFFPSVSAGWRISQESFMKNIDWLSNLKIRASWGKLGNNSIGNYEWQSLYNTDGKVSFGDKITSGLFMYQFANTALTWETTKVTNIGIDFSVLNNRLWGTLDIYDKYTDGILYRPTLSAMLQYFTAPLMNLAEVDNKGFELQLTWNDRVGDWSYMVSGNVSLNRNRVKKYKGELEKGWFTNPETGEKEWRNNIGDISAGGTQRVLEGHMMNEYYMLDRYHGDGTYFHSDGSVNINGGPKDGMIRTEQDMKWLEAMMAAGKRFFPTQGIGKGQIWYGDYIYADTNGDGSYGEEQDRRFMGYSNVPKVYFGLQGSVQWKGIDLSMAWSGAAGFKINYYQNTQNSTNVIHGYGIGKEIGYDHYFFDPANPDDPRTNVWSKNPRFVTGADNGQQKADSEYHLQNGDYIKLKNLTVGYTLPQRWVNKAFMQNVRVYASFENLATITKFKGLDPEMMSGDGYAPMRSYSFGLNVTF